jgi:dolichol-phosphate mannosyltransferase
VLKELMMVELSVVIPVYNEGPNIEKTLRSLRENVGRPYEVLIVYDFDEDNTVPAVRSLQSEFENVSLVKNKIERGPSGAIRSGIEVASAPRVLVAMADLCDDFTQIPALIDLVPAKADVVCPSRYCRGGRQQLRPSFKKFVPRIAGALLRLCIGWNTHDPTNSYKIYSTQMLWQLSLTSTVSFSVTLEIMAKAHCLGHRITELPTVWLDRTHGKSNFKIGRSLVTYMPWFLLALLRNRLFAIPPQLMRSWFALKSTVTAAGEETEQLDH